MNTTTTVQTPGENVLPPTRPPHIGKKQSNHALLKGLRVSMLIAGCMIFILGLLLLLLPMLKVKSIEVEGNVYYNADVIIAAAGIEVGDELPAIDLNLALRKILDNCPYVERCTISPSLFSIKITVVEKENIMKTMFQNQYITFGRDFSVLEIVDEGEAALSPFLYVNLPSIASVTVGKTISFADNDLDTGYITALWNALEVAELFEDVTAVDVSERFSLSFVLDEQYRVELGKIGNIDVKFAALKEILEEKGKQNQECAVVDVSDVQKPTYRPVDKSELLP